MCTSSKTQTNLLSRALVVNQKISNKRRNDIVVPSQPINTILGLLPSVRLQYVVVIIDVRDLYMFPRAQCSDKVG